MIPFGANCCCEPPPCTVRGKWVYIQRSSVSPCEAPEEHRLDVLGGVPHLGNCSTYRQALFSAAAYTQSDTETEFDLVAASSMAGAAGTLTVEWVTADDGLSRIGIVKAMHVVHDGYTFDYTYSNDHGGIPYGCNQAGTGSIATDEDCTCENLATRWDNMLGMQVGDVTCAGGTGSTGGNNGVDGFTSTSACVFGALTLYRLVLAASPGTVTAVADLDDFATSCSITVACGGSPLAGTNSWSFTSDGATLTFLFSGGTSWAGYLVSARYITASSPRPRVGEVTETRSCCGDGGALFDGTRTCPVLLQVSNNSEADWFGDAASMYLRGENFPPCTVTPPGSCAGSQFIIWLQRCWSVYGPDCLFGESGGIQTGGGCGSFAEDGDFTSRVWP